MKVYYPKIQLLAATILLLNSCGSVNYDALDDGVALDSVVVEKSYHMADVDENPACTVRVKFVFPAKLEDQVILTSVQQQFVLYCFGQDYVMLPPNEAVEKYAADYICSFKKTEENFQIFRAKNKSEHEEQWENAKYEWSSIRLIDNQITFNRLGLISFVVRTTFDGKQHSQIQCTAKSISLQTGKAITEMDVFVTDFQDDMARILVESLALSYDVDDANELQVKGGIFRENVKPNQNFFVDECGVTYVFNENEIANNADGGEISVHVPYQKIRHLLRDSTVIVPLAF
jgi:hypothetical protein